MTEDKVLEALNLYMMGDIDMDTLEDRVIPLAFTAEYDDNDLIDHIAIELAYIKDEISDEPLFRKRVAEAVSSHYGPMFYGESASPTKSSDCRILLQSSRSHQKYAKIPSSSKDEIKPKFLPPRREKVRACPCEGRGWG